jgi:hypothetical protein
MKARNLSIALILALFLVTSECISADVNDALEEMTPQLMDALRLNDASGPYLKAETEAVERELAASVFGELTVAEVLPYRDRLNMAAQKDGFVRDMSMLSFKMPGSGHFRMRDFGSGTMFMCMHISLLLGQTVGAFLLLPEGIREIDYINTPYKDVVDRIASYDAGDFLPALQLILVCAVVDLGVRTWASADAAKEAKNRIDGGKITFEPRLGPGFLGFGISY